MTRLSPAEKMVARADADRLPAEHPMRLRAAELAEAKKNYLNPRAYMHVWQRAFDTWHSYTGETFS